MALVKTPDAKLPLVDLNTGAPALSSGGLNLLQGYSNAINGTSGVAAPNVNQVTFGTGTKISSGAGSPEGVVAGSPGDFYTNTTGGAGTTLYVKETGAGTNTGWQAK
jgi:hypothetical protein